MKKNETEKIKFDGSKARIGDIVFEVSDEDCDIMEKASNRIEACREAISTILNEIALQEKVKREFWRNYSIEEEDDKLLRRGLVLAFSHSKKAIVVNRINQRELERALRGFL